ncbi:T7SS effector LXG polymorphic toxin [Gracilibacillus sp. D59]|uniref:T7SS effector LXG polymorphic toxin n=1 Tax=Gracilibacillus sp. D59 TaxID=3457434 RepID=UPI003FCCAF9C
MGHKVDLSEVTDFSDEFKSKSEDIKDSLSKVEQNIEEICNMSSFSGKTADQAKHYFSDLHLTVLTTFDEAFTDLYENLNRHIESFQAKVDDNSSAIIESNYVRDTTEDTKDDYTTLSEQHDSVRSTIHSVADISSATVPSFALVRDDKNTLIHLSENLQEDLDSFTKEGRNANSEIESVLQDVKATLNNAGAVSGSARFTNYQGNSTAIGLANLKEYNQANQQAKQEGIANLDAESKAIYDKAKEDYENGEIDKSVFDAITSGILNTGAGFIKNAATTKLTKEVSEKVAGSIVDWAQRNTLHFVDPALALQTAGGGVVSRGAPPSGLTSAIRTGARYAAPVVGSAIDFGIQIYKGEDATDAAIKTAGHLGAGMAGAAIGSAIPVPVLGTAVGFAVGVGGSMLFDFVYDNKDAIIEGVEDFASGAVDVVKDVGGAIGEAAEGFFDGLGSLFG